MRGDTIKVGTLHSLSGTMAISETTPGDFMLMLIDEQKQARWIAGQENSNPVVDPGVNRPLFC